MTEVRLSEAFLNLLVVMGKQAHHFADEGANLVCQTSYKDPDSGNTIEAKRVLVKQDPVTCTQEYSWDITVHD